MKARIKETGEIINIAEYARVALDKCDSYGTPIEMPFEDVEILQEKSNDIDWEQRRYEIAKEAMWGLLYNNNDNLLGIRLRPSDLVEMVLVYTDTLIKELKKNQQNKE